MNFSFPPVACTTLLEDRYLLPGAEWSLMKKGEMVEVLGRLPNGWYRCRAMRSASMELDTLPSSSTSPDPFTNGAGQEKSEDTETGNHDGCGLWVGL